MSFVSLIDSDYSHILELFRRYFKRIMVHFHSSVHVSAQSFGAPSPNNNDLSYKQAGNNIRHPRNLSPCVVRMVLCLYVFYNMHNFITWVSLSPGFGLTDGPLPDPSMVRPAGPNQMVNRMQGPGKDCRDRHTHCSFNNWSRTENLKKSSFVSA